MEDVLVRINNRTNMGLDNPIVKDIFLSASTEISFLRARVEELQAEILRLQQSVKY